MKEKNSGCIWLFFVLLTALILTGAWLYTGWQSRQRMLPQGLTIGGLNMGGRTREQALTTIAQAYTKPISVRYRQQVILLVPEMVDLELDMEATTANLDKVILAQNDLEGFLQYLVSLITGQQQKPEQITPILTYSRERLDAFLQRVAQQYDHEPLDPVPLPEAETFRPPQPGTTLDIAAARPLLVEAMLSPVINEVSLPVELEPIPLSSMDFLREALTARLADFTGIAGIFVKDLNTSRELCYNCEVAFAGLSTLKIGIVPALYRELDAPPTPQQTHLITTTLSESDNSATNQILAIIGAGNPYSGALKVTDFLWSMGMKNSFMAVPYDLKGEIEPPNIETPANTRTDFNTEPDPYIQTTPLEMGLLLESLSQCSQGGGNLRLLYPREITPAECEDTLLWLEDNEIKTLLQAGMPEDTRVAHKHGWTGDTHADVALVYSPESRFVLSVFLYQPEWLVWEESAPTFASLGQLTYRFFNPSSMEEMP